MGFSDCIKSAASQGALSEDEAASLIRRYEAWTESHAKTDHPGGPEAAAKDSLAKELSDDAARKARIAELTENKRGEIADYLSAFRNLKGKADVVEAAMGLLDNGNNTLHGVDGLAQKIKAYEGYGHGRLEQMLFEMRRNFGLGKRRAPARLDAMIDETFGKATGDGAAKDFVKAWRGVADELVDRFNAAGGDIAKIEGYFPQNHDARRIRKAGEEAWIAFIKDRLDTTQMRDPLTGGPLSQARLDESLSVVFRRIATDGALERDATGAAYGRGALANQRQEHRFLVFKDAAGWREYHAAFGTGTAYDAMMSHLKGLAKDVATLETLGPNPSAMVEWMKQVAQQEAAKAAVGEPSIHAGASGSTKSGKLDDGSWKIERLWKAVNGASDVGSLFAAELGQATRNWLTGAQLGGAALSAIAGDPFQQAIARKFAGVGTLRMAVDLPRMLFDGASRREIARAGVIFEDAMQHLHTQVRDYSLTAASAELSKWVPDRVFEWSGLNAWTAIGQRGAAWSFMFRAADMAEKSLADMRAAGGDALRFGRHLEGHGVTPDDWDVIRKTPRSETDAQAGTLLRPIDVIDANRGDDAAFRAAMKYSAALHDFRENAVPQGNARARAAMKGDSAAGTLGGELNRSAVMYTSYGFNVLWSLMNATRREIGDFGLGRGLSYGVGSLIALTLGGALAIQLKELAKGNDVRKMNGPDAAEFWVLALARGGALGFYGDFLLGDYKRGGTDTAARLPGPVAGMIADAAAVANPKATLSADEHMNRAKTATRFGQTYLPAQNMWWLKPVTQRLIWDRLQKLVDPAAERAWAAQERKLAKEHGQGVWWRRGEAAPDRVPDFVPF